MFKSSKFYYIVSFLSFLYFIGAILYLWYLGKSNLLLIKAIYLPFIVWITINITIGLSIKLYKHITREKRNIENRLIENRKRTYYL